MWGVLALHIGIEPASSRQLGFYEVLAESFGPAHFAGSRWVLLQTGRPTPWGKYGHWCWKLSNLLRVSTPATLTILAMFSSKNGPSNRHLGNWGDEVGSSPEEGPFNAALVQSTCGAVTWLCTMADRFKSSVLVSSTWSQQSDLVKGSLEVYTSEWRSFKAKKSHSKEVTQQRNLTAKKSQSKEVTQQRSLTAKQSHSKEVMHQRSVTSKKSRSKEVSYSKEVTHQRSHTPKKSHSKEVSQQKSLTAKKSRSKEVSHQRSLAAKKSHTGKKSHRKEVSQQRSLTAKKSHSKEVSHQRSLTAKKCHSKEVSHERSLKAKKSRSKEVSQQRCLARKLFFTTWSCSFWRKSRMKASSSHLQLATKHRYTMCSQPQGATKRCKIADFKVISLQASIHKTFPAPSVSVKVSTRSPQHPLLQ